MGWGLLGGFSGESQGVLLYNRYLYSVVNNHFGFDMQLNVI